MSTGSDSGVEAINLIDLIITPQDAEYWVGYLDYQLDAASGDTLLKLNATVPIGAKVTSALASLEGNSYFGPLKNFAGTTIRKSDTRYTLAGVLEPAGGDSNAYTIDFGGMRKISALSLDVDALDRSVVITLVLPWMGTEFGERPLYPYAAETRAPDATGLTQVALPEAETAKLFVQFSGDLNEQEVLNNLSIKSNTYPLNVRVAVGDRPPFFTQPRELIETTPLPDFTDEVNTYLDELSQNGVVGQVEIPLKITTDMPGVVELSGRSLTYNRVAEARWGEGSRYSTTFEGQGRVDVLLAFPTPDSKMWRIKELSFEISHDFPQWRTYPLSMQNSDDKILAKIGADHNVAQKIVMAESTKLYGVGLRLNDIADETQLMLQIVADAAGSPADRQLLAEQSFSITPSASSIWLDLFLSTPLDVAAGDTLWLILKAKIGRAAWVLADAPASGVLFNRAGGGWRPFPYNQGILNARYRLLRDPAVGEDAKVLQLKVAESDVQISSEMPVPITLLTLNYEAEEGGGLLKTPVNGKVELELDVTAHAMGTITFQKVTAQYELID